MRSRIRGFCAYVFVFRSHPRFYYTDNKYSARSAYMIFIREYTVRFEYIFFFFFFIYLSREFSSRIFTFYFYFFPSLFQTFLSSFFLIIRGIIMIGGKKKKKNIRDAFFFFNRSTLICFSGVPLAFDQLFQRPNNSPMCFTSR